MKTQIASDQELDEVFVEIIDDHLPDVMGPGWGNYGIWSRVTHEQGQYFLEIFISPGQALKFDLDEVIAVLQTAKARLGG
jgi:hypothetical protein